MDRIFINDTYRDFAEKLRDEAILGFNLENRESFILAVALGLQEPMNIENKKFNFILLSNLRAVDRAIISAVYLGTAETDEELDQLANFEKSVEYCETCAERGYGMLMEIINNAKGDKDLLERRLMKDIEQLYQKNVEDNL